MGSFGRIQRGARESVGVGFPALGVYVTRERELDTSVSYTHETPNRGPRVKCELPNIGGGKRKLKSPTFR